MTVPRAALAWKAILQPTVLVKAFLRRFPLGSFEFRLALEAFRRPWYAYGVWHAADLARRLKLEAVSVIEFGVAGGDGLCELERVAQEAEKALAIKIHVLGFDTGAGMPQAADHRDLPYVWRKGLYRMDVEKVRSRLSRAELVLGDVATTVPHAVRSGLPAPVGFVAFDLDFHSSTAAAFHIFDGADPQYLPRVLCYFDDIQSGDHYWHSEDVGELLAIREFNEFPGRPDRIRPAYNLAASLPFSPAWAERVWVYHRFHHPLYNTYIGEG